MAVEPTPEQAKSAAIEAWNRRAQPAQAGHFHQALTDPENQPNQYGVEFLMHGPKFAFKVGAQQFTLDYETTEPGEFEFMRDALIHAFSVFTPDVKPAQAGQVLTLDEVRESVHEAGLDWHNGWTMGEDAENRYLNLCRAVEAAVLAKRVPQWLPIETAPKDFVSEFDGWNGERVPNVSWAHPEYSPKGHFDWCVSEYETGHGWVNVAVKNLTHWMPLPPPPGIVGEKGGA
jgi:hypothetical protein